jgi:hypothetical protein
MPSSRVTMRIGSTRSVSLVSTAAMSNSCRKASRTSARQDLRPSLFPRSSRHTRLAAPNLPEARPAGGSRAVAPGRPLLIDQKISVVDHHLRQCRDRAQVGMLPSRRIGFESPRNVGGDASNPVAARNRFPAACGTERGQPKRVVFYAVPMVRIHLPPAESFGSCAPGLEGTVALVFVELTAGITEARGEGRLGTALASRGRPWRLGTVRLRDLYGAGCRSQSVERRHPAIDCAWSALHPHRSAAAGLMVMPRRQLINGRAITRTASFAAKLYR